MDGWKEMTLLPLSVANEMIKNEKCFGEAEQ